ncbi:hypothetical protein [Streptomyces chilikensis]|uniref:Uncharacterized protein n=1 Tax=Streptomyces chilikensis TaxID=1194079 RepID=A0ABV3EVB3_9ACTN
MFLTLEDYAIEPDLAEPGDLDDADLREAVVRFWTAFLEETTGRGR